MDNQIKSRLNLELLAKEIAHTASHELGHAFGLLHEQTQTGLMFPNTAGSSLPNHHEHLYFQQRFGKKK